MPSLDALFQDAVAAIGAGDVPAIERQLAVKPELACRRLEDPGLWLRDQVGGALDGYFRQPWLLWFVAENPVRNGTLPRNVAAVARTIIEAAGRQCKRSVQEQLDGTLSLVVTGRVPDESGVQRGLIDLLIGSGARPAGVDDALGAGNLAAASQLIRLGAPLTLAAALCLGRSEDVVRVASGAGREERQTALVAAAINGLPETLRTLIALGVDPNASSSVIHPHATPLHHAVGSESLDAVKILVNAGASLDSRDLIYDGTPRDWATHLGRTEISVYLRGMAADKHQTIAD